MQQIVLTRIFFRLQTSQARVTPVRRLLGGHGLVPAEAELSPGGLDGFAAWIRTYRLSMARSVWSRHKVPGAELGGPRAGRECDGLTR